MVQSKAMSLAYLHNNDLDLAVLVQNVCKSYTDVQPVLQNISMNVEQGIVYGLLGSSGCGKTTLLSCIVGLKEFESGEISVLGNKIGLTDIHTLAKCVGYMPQDLALYEQLTVKEIFKYYGKLHGLASNKIAEMWLFLVKLLNLPDFASQRVTNLSGGQKRRVSLALALIHSPKLLILDEPTVGLDPLLRKSIWNHLYNLTSMNNTTIIITTHYIEEVRNSFKVGVMRSGRMLIEDNPKSLMITYQASLLEDVVLKICRKDHNHRKNNLVHNHDQPNKQNEHNMLNSVKVDNQLQFQSISKKKFEQYNEIQGIIGTNGKYLMSPPVDNQNIVTDLQSNNISVTLPGQNVADDRVKDGCWRKCVESVKRIAAYAQVVLINFIRNPVLFSILLILPPFQIFSTIAVIGVEPKDIPVGLVNNEILNWKESCFRETDIISRNNNTCDLTSISCNVIKHLYSGDFISPIEFLTETEADLAVRRGNIIGYIKIPGNYSSNIVERAVLKQFAGIETVEGSNIGVHMDMTDFITVFFTMTNLFKSYQNFITELTSTCDFNLNFVEVPIQYKEPVYGSMDVTPQSTAIPALLNALLFEILFVLPSIILINEIKQGTLQRAQVAGLRFSEVMAGLFFTMVLLSLLEGIVTYTSLAYGMSYVVHGSVPLFIFICTLTGVCAGMCGLLIGIISQDVLAVILVGMCMVPVIVLDTGSLQPIEAISGYWRYIIMYLIPTAASVESFHSVANRAVGLTHPTVWPGLVWTSGWFAVLTLICLLLVRKMKT